MHSRVLKITRCTNGGKSMNIRKWTIYITHNLNLNNICRWWSWCMHISFLILQEKWRKPKPKGILIYTPWNYSKPEIRRIAYLEIQIQAPFLVSSLESEPECSSSPATVPPTAKNHGKIWGSERGDGKEAKCSDFVGLGGEMREIWAFEGDFSRAWKR